MQMEITMVRIPIQSFSDIITNSSSEIFQTIEGSEETIDKVYKILHPLFREDGWYNEELPTMRVLYKSKIEEDPEEYGFEDTELSDLPKAWIEIWLPYGLENCSEFFRAGIKALLETNNIKDYKHKDLFSKVKVREFPEKNYKAIWHDLKTLRVGEGIAKELDPDKAEFYDIGINTKCNVNGGLGCDFCYVSASGSGKNYEGICETWKKWMNTFPEDEVDEYGIIHTEKPYQIAIGSTGEPTIHPQFCEFLQTVYETGVVPNYTTNGLTLCNINNPLTQKILDYTHNFVGGVAVSFGNKKIREYAEEAVNNLLNQCDVKVNIHHIISNKESVDEFVKIQKKYGSDIYYHVLLPLMPSGRSTKGIEEGVFKYMEDAILSNDMKNVSFGAHFIDSLKESKIKTWLYPAESLSKNIILEKDKVIITPSSFNLKPIKEINL